MIVIVLFTMLLLAAILFSSMQLSMSASRTTEDQRATLVAQYAAESNLNVARSQLRNVGRMLSGQDLSAEELGSGSQPLTPLSVPADTSVSSIEAMAVQFCGTNTPLVNWTVLPGFQPNPNAAPVNGQVYTDNNARVCTVQLTGQVNQFELLGRFIRPEIYTALLAPRERPTNLSSVDSRAAFWRDVFSNSNNTLARTDSRLQLNALQVIKYTPASGGRAYRFVLGAGNVIARGNQAGATRVLSGSNVQSQQTWYFELTLPSLLKNVLQTNFHRSRGSDTPNVNFLDQVFNGPVHTNEHLVFANGATATFNGGFSSAGCTNLDSEGTAGWTCTKRPGYYSAGQLRALPQGSYTPRQYNNSLNADLDNRTDVNIINPEPDPPEDYAVNDGNFAADYIALPENAEDQRAAANGEGTPPGEAGLIVPSNATGIQLLAGDANGNPLTTFNSSTTSWTEPTNTYQYIRFYSTEEQCSYDTSRWEQVNWQTYNNTPEEFRGRDSYGRYYRRPIMSCDPAMRGSPVREYRVDSEGNLSVKSGSSWNSTGQKFNGVIYGDQISNVIGPPRNNVSNPLGREVLNNAPPALASFSKVTIAGVNGVRIGSDLTMSNAPCRLEDTACNKNPLPKNMLGIYSQAGDLTISGNAPADLKIHAALMSSEGEVRVNNYDKIPQRGSVHMRGALIENWYGPFGTFNPQTRENQSGYGRNFSYDNRYREGLAPPYWPVSPTWTTLDASSRTRLEDVQTRQATTGEFR
ncbi:hypothetical protein [Deinococcus radiophilus]|uniref:DUF4900 domain-containing protein n=2 Tax=Deinococcus radiophilus TaxID=32062 RepID=A0A431W456_9DEIO|nr:hypothetical protein [Deinococcus radiophilus]RTR30249.1 hypothetical protein EJ104_01700 [Deinococcus radiophilus]UFA49958.1 hypothetical protein LMT64_08700 [Deinococcus radiophilus]